MLTNQFFSKHSFTLGRAIIYGLLILLAVYYLLPLYVMLATSVKPIDELRDGNLLSLPNQFDFSAWVKAWSHACTGVQCEGLKPFFWNSVIIVVPSVLISTFIGAFNGYVFSHWRFRGSDIIFSVMLVGCFIPFQVVLLPMARLLGSWELANSVYGLILVHAVYGLAFTTLFFRNFYIGVSKDLINAARVGGAGFFGIFYRIMFPVSSPIFYFCMICQFTQIWNDFLFGVVFSGSDSQPITVALNNLVNTSTGTKEYNVDMAAAMIAALPTLIVYIISGRYFVRGLTAGAVKG